MLNKVFTEFTDIVAIWTTGNVFYYDAIKELNIKTKNWKELLTDEPFTKEDLITIQVISSIYNDDHCRAQPPFGQALPFTED
ncbi:hypothetical protein Patl1_04374 [Pistacia atlantica]|uniref:Uncharacterized protein n=1 Tax=Pistacia atlantica TaxID=434234 RepID=A0ACC1BU71_9ROSI|nr:hypothetical protein Patl1_04374 [Pistacia atlantica]